MGGWMQNGEGGVDLTGRLRKEKDAVFDPMPSY